MSISEALNRAYIVIEGKPPTTQQTSTSKSKASRTLRQSTRGRQNVPDLSSEDKAKEAIRKVQERYG
jgi:translation initiation factor 2 beta subunit (eIF-2beta)/eIF-5